MGLEELLTKLDKKIWQKCERITRLAYKELGWNKYDLKMMIDACSSVFLTGMGAYSFIQGAYQINNSNASFSTYLLSGIGGALVPGSFLFYSKCKKENQRLEQLERKLLEDKEVIYAPKFTPYRPLSLGSGITFLPLAAAYRYMHGSDTYHTAVALFFSTVGASLVTSIISTYFQDQSMTPPTKKKSFLEKIYEFSLQPFKNTKEIRPENIFTGA